MKVDNRVFFHTAMSLSVLLLSFWLPHTLESSLFLSLMFISFTLSLESMYLIYRKHKLCHSLVVRWCISGGLVILAFGVRRVSAA